MQLLIMGEAEEEVLTTLTPEAVAPAAVLAEFPADTSSITLTKGSASIGPLCSKDALSVESTRDRLFKPLDIASITGECQESDIDI